MPLRCDIEIVNDELYVIDDKGALFEYNPTDKESVRVQHTLFHEKQTLIENCLFGVDINPNSVKICRLRLWIELLKNAYYTPQKRLQTLPNIDINIKCGNSLISRFKLDDDLKGAFKNKDLNYTFTDYKNAVTEYKETNNKDRKKEVLQIIDEVKNNFKSTLDNAFLTKYQKAQGELINEQERQNNLKTFGEKIKKTEKDELKKLKVKAEKTYLEKEEIVNNAIYENSFEWRFEFPEVLNDEGTYVGFDAIIGNPPYIIEYNKIVKSYLENNFIEFKRNNDLYVAFISNGYSLIKENGFLSFITPNTFLKGTYFIKLRELLIKNKIHEIIDFKNRLVFDEANVYTAIIRFQKKLNPKNWLLKKNINEIEGEIDKDELDFLYKSQLIKRLDTYQKFEKFFLIKDVGFNYWSIGRGKTRGNSVGSRILYSGDKSDSNDKSYLKGGDIFRYSNRQPSNYLRNNYEDLLNENDVFRYSKDFFEMKPKIIYRQTSKDIIATIDLQENYNDKTVHILVNNEESNFNLYYVVGLLNSSLLNYYLHFYKQEEGKAFAQIKTVDIKRLPFLFDKTFSTSIAKQVNEIFTLKKDNPKADTTILEKEIDQMVYKLYDLTEEEIAIVENR